LCSCGTQHTVAEVNRRATVRPLIRRIRPTQSRPIDCHSGSMPAGRLPGPRCLTTPKRAAWRRGSPAGGQRRRSQPWRRRGRRQRGRQRQRRLQPHGRLRRCSRPAGVGPLGDQSCKIDLVDGSNNKIWFSIRMIRVIAEKCITS
jgi:hypothetical protein